METIQWSWMRTWSRFYRGWHNWCSSDDVRFAFASSFEWRAFCICFVKDRMFIVCSSGDICIVIREPSRYAGGLTFDFYFSRHSNDDRGIFLSSPYMQHIVCRFGDFRYQAIWQKNIPMMHSVACRHLQAWCIRIPIRDEARSAELLSYLVIAPKHPMMRYVVPNC